MIDRSDLSVGQEELEEPREIQRHPLWTEVATNRSHCALTCVYCEWRLFKFEQTELICGEDISSKIPVNPLRCGQRIYGSWGSSSLSLGKVPRPLSRVPVVATAEVNRHTGVHIDLQLPSAFSLCAPAIATEKATAVYQMGETSTWIIVRTLQYRT